MGLWYLVAVKLYLVFNKSQHHLLFLNDRDLLIAHFVVLVLKHP